MLVSIPRDPAWLGLHSLQTKAVEEPEGSALPREVFFFGLCWNSHVEKAFQIILKLSMYTSKKQAEKPLRDTPVPFNHTLLLI